MHHLHLNPTTPYSPEETPRILMPHDELQIKIMAALGKNVTQSIEPTAQHSQMQKTFQAKYHQGKKADLITEVLQDVFALEDPIVAQEDIELFLSAGGNFKQIRHFLKKAVQPDNLEKLAIFFDIIRRTIQIEENHLQNSLETHVKRKKSPRVNTSQEVTKTTKLFKKLLNSENIDKVLHECCRKNLKDLAIKIVEWGVNVNTPFPGTGASPLYTAALAGNIDLMTWLLSKNADVNAASSEIKDHQANTKDGKETPLHAAATNGHLDAVSLLISHKADPNKYSAKGFTSLHYACQNNRSGIAEYLLEHGAQVNATSIEGVTPLHYACLSGDIELIKILLRHGADATIVDNYGETPFQAIRKVKHKQIIANLLSDFPAVQKLLKQPIKNLIPKLRQEPDLLLVDRKDIPNRNPLEAVLYLGDRELASNLAIIMPPEDYQFALDELAKKYPTDSLKLLLDAHLRMKKAFAYQVGSQPEVPPVPLLPLDSFLSLFPQVEFKYSPKLSSLSPETIFFDEKGNLWTEEKITQEKTKLHLRADHLATLTLEAVKQASHPYVIMKIGNTLFPIKIQNDGGVIKIQPSIEMLLPIFHKINFKNPKAPGYRDPELIFDSSDAATLEDKRIKVSLTDLEKGLKVFIHRIKFRIPRTGTPSEHKPEELEAWYAYLESTVRHVIRVIVEEDIQALLKKEKDPTPSAPAAITYGITGPWCGTRFLDDCQFLYETKTSRVRTFEEQIIHYISQFKKGITDSLIDRNDIHNVHETVAIQQLVDLDAGIPEEEKKNRYYFKDPIPSYLDQEKILAGFWAKFNPSTITDLILEQFNKKTLFNEELVFQWFKDHISFDYEKTKYDAIHEVINNFSTVSEKVKYLEQFDIVINPPLLKEPEKLNWERIIEQDRQFSFMENVIMSPTRGYRRSAVAHMLSTLGAFQII